MQIFKFFSHCVVFSLCISNVPFWKIEGMEFNQNLNQPDQSKKVQTPLEPKRNWVVKEFQKAGCALIALGVLGNAIAYINATDYDPNSFMGTIKSICSYPVPTFSGDPGVASAVNNLCTEFWQKILVFTGGALLPGIALLVYSLRHSSERKVSSPKKS